MNDQIDPATFDFLSSTDTCSLANAIESLDVRLRNEGFNGTFLRCRFPELPPMMGYATTLRVRASAPPPKGHAYYDRMDWWKVMEESPLPHILVIEDVDVHPGTGAFVGEVHAAILTALGCVGAVTNGAVRDLPAIERMRFNLFSNTVSVSHAYVHIVEIGTPVTIDGLEIRQGDLLHGDQHGVITVPTAIAKQLPNAVTRLRRREAIIRAFCQSAEFSTEGLQGLLKGEAPLA